MGSISFKFKFQNAQKEGSSSNYFPTIILRRPNGQGNGEDSVSALGLLGKATEHLVLTGTYKLSVLQVLNHHLIC